MSDQDIYRRFIDWLGQTWWPLAEADELMPVVMARYTPEEASLLTGVPFSGRNLEEMAEMKQMDPAELTAKLDKMARRGLVFRTVRGDTIRYSLNDSLFVLLRSSFWHGRTDEDTTSLAPLVNQYYYHGFFDQYDLTHIKGLRVLPIQETIEDTRQILPYEEVVKVLDSQDYFAVSTCPCRHRKNIDPDSPDCNYPTENCLHFGRLGRYSVENGLGREITRREAHDILRRCAEVGLVHGVSNWLEGVDTICNCCKCCCIWFEAFHKLKHSMSITPSNYRVHTNSDTCTGCELCTKRCPMEALRLEDFPQAKNRITRVPAEDEKDEVELKNKKGKVSVVNPDLCIGCGVCAYKCPSKSLVLERRETIQHPPENASELRRLVVEDFMAARLKNE